MPAVELVDTVIQNLFNRLGFCLVKFHRLKFQRISGIDISIKVLNIITSEHQSDSVAAMPTLVFAFN